MEQRSTEWLETRKKHIGASDAPIIMGVSPYKTVGQLWKEKLSLVDNRPPTGPMLYGIRYEKQALEAFMQETGIYVEPDVLFHSTIPYLMASMDGIDWNRKTAVEIKCAGKKDHQLAIDGIVPSKYYPQLQHQIEVAKLDKIYYYSYSLDSTALITVPRDQNYINIMLEKEKEFWKCVQEFIEIN